MYLGILVLKVVFHWNPEDRGYFTHWAGLFLCFRMGNSTSSSVGKSASTPVNQIQVSDGADGGRRTVTHLTYSGSRLDLVWEIITKFIFILKTAIKIILVTSPTYVIFFFVKISGFFFPLVWECGLCVCAIHMPVCMCGGQSREVQYPDLLLSAAALFLWDGLSDQMWR